MHKFIANFFPWSTHNLFGLRLDSFTILIKAFISNLPFLSFKSLTHAYLVKTSKFNNFPNQKILVPRTSWGRSPPTSQGRDLNILFDHPWDVSIWRPCNDPIWHPGDVPKWRPLDVLSDVQGTPLVGWLGIPQGHSQGIPLRTFKTRLWDDVGSSVGFAYFFIFIIIIFIW